MIVSKTLTFTRTESDNEYFTDLNVCINSAVKFDLFENDIQIATIVTNNKETAALTSDNISLKGQHTLWTWKSDFVLKDKSEQLIATIKARRPFFWGSNIFEVFFEDTYQHYTLKKRRHKDSKREKADFCYDLITNNVIECSIIVNYVKPGVIFSNPLSEKLKGLIKCDEKINIIQILCFFQLIQIEIDFNFNS